LAADEIIEISLLSGRSDRPTLTFTPGTPTNPVSVGSDGQWRVSGDGVEPVHIYLVFDGRQVHVALAAPGSGAQLAGARVGADWTLAPVPCELRFGGACLILRYAPRPVSAQEERTMHDGGALLLAAQRAAASAGAPSALQAPQLGAQYPTARPAAGAPAGLGRTLPLKGAPARVLDAHEEATTLRAPRVGPEHGAQPANEPLQQEVTRIAPQPLAPRATRPEPAPGTLAPVPPPAPAAAPSTARAAAGALAYWRDASPVKKTTLVLMPFALVGSYVIFQDAPQPAPRAATPSSAAARQTAVVHDAGTVAAVATTEVAGEGSGDSPATPPAASSSDPRTEPARPAAGRRTAERAALDAVAAGSFDEASKLYADLATAHPDDPAYKEATRILREKTGGTR
jgi:hypothetical protein